MDEVFAKEWHDNWFALMPPDLKPFAHQISRFAIYVKNDFDMRYVNPDYVFAKFNANSMIAHYIETSEGFFENTAWHIIITNDDYICCFQDNVHYTGCNGIFGIPEIIAVSKSKPMFWHFTKHLLDKWDFAKSNPHIYIDDQTAYIEHQINCLQIASIHEFYTLRENVDKWQTWASLEHILADEYLAKTIAKY